ncbi:hypothetical protein SELSPUOL_02351 [Selenomonas sputigena ATCC 35185]|uniref:Uncharacterized protein n=1 Tax=Selenomonas sputigena (strain ATCC 35185 / DSM 20758 / CCUG 44933 / VPI D19B-28) TaxID=546271 RepID=C9LXZ1_SELS3|nr:hypothetical protein SELSPUOL_02351 [Selenomonas sputigena ATCC 35185]
MMCLLIICARFKNASVYYRIKSICWQIKNAGFSPEKLDIVVLRKDYWHILMIF